MKIKLSIISFLLIITVFIYSNSKKEGMNNLLLENIEALADEEYDSTAKCYGRGSVDCPYTDIKVKYVMEGYSLEGLY